MGQAAVNLAKISKSALCDRGMDGQTNGPIEGLTDRRMLDAFDIFSHKCRVKASTGL